MLLAAAAAGQQPAASCTSDPKAGRLVIRYTYELNEENPPWPASPEPVLFFSLLVLDSTGSVVEETRSDTLKFNLKSDTFEVILEPGVPNVYLQGRCGAAVTGVVTVKRNGKVVLNAKEFEDIDCHKRERFISRIAFRAGSSKPEIRYAEYP